jgi:hypothetical protein
MITTRMTIAVRIRAVHAALELLNIASTSVVSRVPIRV